MTESGGEVSRPEVQAAKAPGETSRQRRSSLGAAVAGFLLGAVVWHFVGFWTFLSGVVLHGPEAARGRPPAALSGPANEVAQTALPPAAARFRLASRGGSAGPANCSAAIVDRSSGAVTVSACDRRTKRFAKQHAGRADRTAASAATGARPEAAAEAGNGGGWIVQVDARSER